MHDRMEALADAMMKINGWDDPGSRCYQLRNPLLLRAFSLSRMQEQDAEGVRIFASFVAGYRAGIHDLRTKLQGGSRAGLPPDATLRQLLGTYGLQHPVAVKKVVHWLERALACSDGTIYSEMSMSWFLSSSAPKAGATADASAIAAERVRGGGLQTNAKLISMKGESIHA